MPIQRIVIDVLIPHELDVVDFAERMAEADEVEQASIHVLEVDEKTKTVAATVEGRSLSVKAIERVIEELGGSIHSVDMVSAGSKSVESRVTKREEE